MASFASRLVYTQGLESLADLVDFARQRALGLSPVVGVN